MITESLLPVDLEPMTLLQFQALIASKIEEIPPEYRATAKVSCRSHGGYYYAEMEINWERPENQADIDSRANLERVIAQEEKNRELAQLAHLQAKYGLTPA